VREDTSFVLALAGTLAIHAGIFVIADAVTGMPHEPRKPTPHVELVEIEVPPVLKPPPPPVRAPEPVKPPEPAPPETPKPRAAAVQPVAPPPPSEPPPPAPAPAPDPGGAPTVSMPDLGPAATGVAVAPGPVNTGKVGRGGTGTGTGSGAGAGADPVPVPMSVASIKTLARAKGDYDYTKDYPAEARQLGIEGDIRVRLTVDDKGKVKAAVLLNRLGHGLDEMAMAHAQRIEFEPARDTDDHPVSSFVVWTFHMILPK
jgi:TonB family protein